MGVRSLVLLSGGDRLRSPKGFGRKSLQGSGPEVGIDLLADKAHRRLKTVRVMSLDASEDALNVVLLGIEERRGVLTEAALGCTLLKEFITDEKQKICVPHGKWCSAAL